MPAKGPEQVKTWLGELEEVTEDLPALLRQHPALHHHPVVQETLPEELPLALHDPRLGLQRTEYHPHHPRMHDQPRTHAARLQGHIQGAAG
ncbi:hypothetical protein O164_21940 [Pseudomonas taiwanensis SJ9]|uniref:Uncharacterized protein n=1 Tax=Pseudomonas taiwanensis SJ9 TaxID=1388762 RepID=V7D8E4_9PSED|nr:hypothetical protein O164_21940 [Pseudomonas taiwanensis SJ9]